MMVRYIFNGIPPLWSLFCNHCNHFFSVGSEKYHEDLNRNPEHDNNLRRKNTNKKTAVNKQTFIMNKNRWGGEKTKIKQINSLKRIDRKVYICNDRDKIENDTRLLLWLYGFYSIWFNTNIIFGMRRDGTS